MWVACSKRLSSRCLMWADLDNESSIVKFLFRHFASSVSSNVCSSAVLSCSFYSCLNVFVLCVEVPVTYLAIVLSLYVQRILPCAQSDLDFGLHTTKYYETYTAKLELRTEPYVTFVFSYRPVCSLRYVLCHVLIVSASQRQILY